MHAGGAGDDITLASAASGLWENDKLFNELFITPAEYGLITCLTAWSNMSFVMGLQFYRSVKNASDMKAIGMIRIGMIS